jgi:hypothetical protein
MSTAGCADQQKEDPVAFGRGCELRDEQKEQGQGEGSAGSSSRVWTRKPHKLWTKGGRAPAGRSCMSFCKRWRHFESSAEQAGREAGTRRREDFDPRYFLRHDSEEQKHERRGS